MMDDNFYIGPQKASSGTTVRAGHFEKIKEFAVHLYDCA